MRDLGFIRVIAVLNTIALVPAVCGEASAIPASVSAANYPDLLSRPPFRRVLALSESLVLSGVATLPAGKVVTV